MQVPNNAFVVVADGRKMLFLRNEGDAEHPNLQLERKREQDNPSDLEQKTDKAGRASSTWGAAGSSASSGGQAGTIGGAPGAGQGGQFAASRGSMGETDFHQMEEDRFAKETAELLKKRALNNDFESLIIVAPPKTLGELRKHYHKEVSDRLTGELDKDLTGHPLDEIEQALMKA